MRFRLWFENQELKDSIRDQLATAMNMQSNKETFGDLPIDTMKQSIIKALQSSSGWMSQYIPDPDKRLAAPEWVKSAQPGKRIVDLIEYLAGEESANPTTPDKKPTKQQPPPPQPAPAPPAPAPAPPPPPMPGAPPPPMQ